MVDKGSSLLLSAYDKQKLNISELSTLYVKSEDIKIFLLAVILIPL